MIYDPNRDELYQTENGKGAFLNGKKISVSSPVSLQRSLMLTGFAYDRQKHSSFYLHYFTHFIENARGVRRCGSAALDLAYIAAGRGDGFWEFNLNPWDVAAGILLIREAGGFVTSIYPEQNALDGNIIACSPNIKEEILGAFEKLHGARSG